MLSASANPPATTPSTPTITGVSPRCSQRARAAATVTGSTRPRPSSSRGEPITTRCSSTQPATPSPAHTVNPRTTGPGRSESGMESAAARTTARAAGCSEERSRAAARRSVVSRSRPGA